MKQFIKDLFRDKKFEARLASQARQHFISMCEPMTLMYCPGTRIVYKTKEEIEKMREECIMFCTYQCQVDAIKNAVVPYSYYKENNPEQEEDAFGYNMIHKIIDRLFNNK